MIRDGLTRISGRRRQVKAIGQNALVPFHVALWELVCFCSHSLRVPGATGEHKPIHKHFSNLCVIMFAHVPLAKESHVAKPRPEWGIDPS